MNLFNRDVKTLYCKECGAEVYSNEKRCWNCDAKIKNSGLMYFLLPILCLLSVIVIGSVFLGFKQGTRGFNEEVLEVSIGRLSAEIESDPDAFKQKFNNKIVRVTSKIHDYNSFSGNEIEIDDLNGDYIGCHIRQDQLGEVLKQEPGTPVTIEGLLICCPWRHWSTSTAEYRYFKLIDCSVTFDKE